MTISARPPVRPSLALADDDHERIVIRQDRATGMRFIVAVHSTVLGPALGGLRLKRYPGGLTRGAGRRDGPGPHDDPQGLGRRARARRRQGRDDRRRPDATRRDARLDRGRRRDRRAGRRLHHRRGHRHHHRGHGPDVAAHPLRRRAAPLERGGGGDPSPVTAETVFQAIRCGLARRRRLTTSRPAGAWAWSGSARSATRWPRGWPRAGADVVACDLDAARAERFAAEHGEPGGAVGRGGARHASST